MVPEILITTGTTSSLEWVSTLRAPALLPPTPNKQKAPSQFLPFGNRLKATMTIISELRAPVNRSRVSYLPPYPPSYFIPVNRKRFHSIHPNQCKPQRLYAFPRSGHGER